MEVENGKQIFTRDGIPYSINVSPRGKPYMKSLGKQIKDNQASASTPDPNEYNEIITERSKEEAASTIKAVDRMLTEAQFNTDSIKGQCVLRVDEVGGFSELLTDEAKVIYNKYNKGYFYEVDGRTITLRFLSRKIQLGADNVIPSCYINKIAYIFNKLVEAKMINYGVMCPLSTIQLVPNINNPTDNSWAIFIFVYSDHTNEELNKFIGEEFFYDEGFVGPDWGAGDM